VAPVGPPAPRHRFTSEDYQTTVQLGDNLLVVNQLPPYYGWEKFEPVVDRCFRLYLDLWKPETVARAGAHYLDKVDIPKVEFDLAEYFNLYPRLPDNQLGPIGVPGVPSSRPDRPRGPTSTRPRRKVQPSSTSAQPPSQMRSHRARSSCWRGPLRKELPVRCEGSGRLTAGRSWPVLMWLTTAAAFCERSGYVAPAGVCVENPVCGPTGTPQNTSASQGPEELPQLLLFAPWLLLLFVFHDFAVGQSLGLRRSVPTFPSPTRPNLVLAALR
jgi:hypothetical protein